MDIDFIKWLFEKADGFEFIEANRRTSQAYYAYLGREKTVGSYSWKTTYYPLLLQRAIEGVNRGRDYTIIQSYDEIRLLDADFELISGFFYDESIDTAKESSLRYIYEQEKK